MPSLVPLSPQLGLKGSDGLVFTSGDGMSLFNLQCYWVSFISYYRSNDYILHVSVNIMCDWLLSMRKGQLLSLNRIIDIGKPIEAIKIATISLLYFCECWSILEFHGRPSSTVDHRMGLFAFRVSPCVLRPQFCWPGGSFSILWSFLTFQCVLHSAYQHLCMTSLGDCCSVVQGCSQLYECWAFKGSLFLALQLGHDFYYVFMSYE